MIWHQRWRPSGFVRVEVAPSESRGTFCFSVGSFHFLKHDIFVFIVSIAQKRWRIQCGNFLFVDLVYCSLNVGGALQTDATTQWALWWSHKHNLRLIIAFTFKFVFRTKPLESSDQIWKTSSGILAQIFCLSWIINSLNIKTLQAWFLPCCATLMKGLKTEPFSFLNCLKRFYLTFIYSEEPRWD